VYVQAKLYFVGMGQTEMSSKVLQQNRDITMKWLVVGVVGGLNEVLSTDWSGFFQHTEN
jgi:hypothetical protein